MNSSFALSAKIVCQVPGNKNNDQGLTLALLVTSSSLRRWISDVPELLAALKGVTRGDWERGLVKGLRLCGDMLDAKSKRPPPPLILPTPLAPRNAAVPCWRPKAQH